MTGGGDRWADGRAVLRAADPRMAVLVDADPALDPDSLLDGLPRDLWGALVIQVIGQQLSLAAAAAIAARLDALHGGRLPTPAELLATDADALRGIGLSRAKAVYLHDLAARMEDGRLDLERLRTLDDDAARTELTQVKGVGRFTAEGVLDARPPPPGRLARRRPRAAPRGRTGLGTGSPGIDRGRRRHRRAVPTVEDARRGLPLPHQGGIARTSTGCRAVPSAWTQPPRIAAPGSG